MTSSSIFERLRKSPGLFLPSVDYDVAVAFLLGFDAATEGGCLMGFREWLVPQLGGGNNLHWAGLVLNLMKRETEVQRSEGNHSEKERVEFLLSTLDMFHQERTSSDGLRAIYLRYEAWLRTQSWYTPPSA
ncbi:hypothetical protein [Pyxidicoccus sp. MSG2]|uniref:hypothetical protein n=1 Tax=Pyxidicoccus sp. MSG2 TaxID=2996790 RepID=UPI00226DD3B2|nr:hypothetical protein [Pyxidicoccus sp. MSG2]MCY1018558.1 hypothetical protein [Pyxidicoccus sp. MSG2]